MTGAHVLIAALSGRALAGSARRAGYLPLVADMFGDLDTQAAAIACVRAGSFAHGFRRAELLAALAELEAGRAPVGLVYGAGFEDRPGLIGAVAKRHVLLGNSADAVARAKDPLGFAALCRTQDVPHPETALAPGDGWLVKRVGGSGGVHIRPARPGERLRRGRYAQRRVEGWPVSALFLGDGRAGVVLGFSAQWAAPLPRRPYRYGGAVRPAAVPHAREAVLTEAIERLIPPLGLRGLNSADFLLRADGFDLIEINPRPGATLDVHPDAEGQLFALHVQACRGALPSTMPQCAGAAAAAVVYAPYKLRVAEGFAWPDWTADRQPCGDMVPQDAPLCTVRAEAADADAACAVLQERARTILVQAAAA